MKNWKIEIVTTTSCLSKEEVVSILQSEIEHPEIECLLVTEIEEYKNNVFLGGFQSIANNFRRWKTHIDSRLSIWQDSNFFWDKLLS